MSDQQFVQYPPLFLVGARASGKSTMGAYLARALTVALPQQGEWCFLDTDDLLTRALGESIADFVGREGWEAFRHQESLAVRAACAPLTVLATGGGCILDPANGEFMRSKGCVLYLHAPAELLLHRLEADPRADQRPPLSPQSPQSPLSPQSPCEAGSELGREVAQCLRIRDPLYRQAAHAVLNADAPEHELLGALLRAYSEFLAGRG